MGVFTATSLLLVTPNLRHESGSSHLFPPTRKSKKKSRALVPVISSFLFIFKEAFDFGKNRIDLGFVLLDQVARLFGPAIFEASKLKVLFLGVDEKKHPGKFPRTYTLTHSDITSKLTLAVSHTINNSQVSNLFVLFLSQQQRHGSDLNFDFEFAVARMVQLASKR